MASTAQHAFFGRRLQFASLIACSVIGVLVARLWYLQCMRGSYFRDLSENNRTRTIRTIAPRGNIYDREGRVLVSNRPAFDVALITEDIRDLKETLSVLAEITGRDKESLQTELELSKSRRHFEPKVVISDASRSELARIKANTYRLPGVMIDVSPARFYPFGPAASQVLGYAREISRAQLESETSGEYRRGDVIGQSGLEKNWEDELRGSAGFRQVEVDAMGNRKGELGIVDSRSGSDLYLTIDIDLQQALDRGFAGRRGAAVVIDARNGEVLALTSSPSVDGNMFSGAMNSTDWKKMIEDPALPLRNRAISSKYPIGSTFKLILALAGLAEKKITKESTFYCPGFFMFAGRPYRCHKASGHGSVNLLKALTVSCNAYFYQVGQLLGIGGINKYATMLGLGTPTDIDLPGEVEGVMPSEEWKLRVLGEHWYPGDTVSVSIGQGFVSITPIQLAVAAAAIANGGTVFKPILVKKMVTAGSKETFDHPKPKIKVHKAELAADKPEMLRPVHVSIDSEVLAEVRTLSANVVNTKEGTGTKAALPGVTVGGKTGTAQVAGLGRGRSPELGDHAWFVAYAPIEDPMIALAIIVENGGHGGSAAAPISRDVMEVYFKKLGLLKEEPPPPVPAVKPKAAGRGKRKPVAPDAARPAPEPASSQSQPEAGNAPVAPVSEPVQEAAEASHHEGAGD